MWKTLVDRGRVERGRSGPPLGDRLGKEVEGDLPGASERMDRQLDGPGSRLSAQMVVEHEAIDAEDRSGSSPPRRMVGVAAVCACVRNPSAGVRSTLPAVRRSTARLCVAWQLSHVSSSPASANSARMNCAWRV